MVLIMGKSMLISVNVFEIAKISENFLLKLTQVKEPLYY